MGKEINKLKEQLELAKRTGNKDLEKDVQERLDKLSKQKLELDLEIAKERK